MNQDQSNLTFDESVAQVMQSLPQPIRSYLVQGKCTVVAGDLIRKYGLHVDQGGILEREITLLLMGIESPNEFTEALAEEAGLAQQTISSIMQDVNVQIFVPLREQIQKEGVGGAQQSVAAPQAQRATTLAPARPVNMPTQKYYAPPPQSPAYSHLDNKFTPSPLVSKIAPLPPKGVLPPREGSQNSVNLLASNKPPATAFVNPPATLPPPVIVLPKSAETPLQQALRTVLPPENLPGALPPPSDIIPPTPKAPPPQSVSGVDPYREPVE